ncbi:hypothetical protein PMAYCL1PPCAC_14782, partial [Pristionchus mayeri]
IPKADGTKEWQWRTLAGMACDQPVIFATLVVICFCLVRILQEMRKIGHHVESDSRRMQRKLIRVLLWQSIIPTITSYIPITFIAAFPLF